ncbi:hypothetical protein Taro_036374 [Colocasia esculenta]|uniref:Uncharacterized protein n=1 Tax=Colocasia esculenta TaxID=4460 RepID=A0A843W2X8_COLES|nr:hypothetical protein [Colocasia esculenta]
MREREKSSGARALSPDPEKATHPLSQSIKPEGDIGYVAFKKATYPLSQYEAEPDTGAIGTTSRQSPCRDPEDEAKGPRGPGCYNSKLMSNDININMPAD